MSTPQVDIYPVPLSTCVSSPLWSIISISEQVDERDRKDFDYVRRFQA